MMDELLFVSANALPRSDGLPCGWSAVAGQGQSAYVRGGVDPKDSIGGHGVSDLA
jgi:hypothetical protein